MDKDSVDLIPANLQIARKNETSALKRAAANLDLFPWNMIGVIANMECTTFVAAPRQITIIEANVKTDN